MKSAVNLPARLLVAVGCVASLGVGAIACGDDDNAPIRPGADASFDAPPPGTSDASVDAGPCGVPPTATYDGSAFATNAAVELGLRAQMDALLKPMKDVETALSTPDAGAPVAVTAQQLKDLYAAGTPSLKSVTTPFYQAKVDAWADEYGTAFGNVWAPAEPPPATGGQYGKWIVNARGIDLRQAMEKGSYSAAFYNHAVNVIAQGVTPVAVDRLVAAFGAHPSFPNDPAAAQNPDVNAASYAARRDSKKPESPGPYQRAKAALIKAKVLSSVPACAAERDAAVTAFLLEWEKSTFATAIFYLNDLLQVKLGGASPDMPAAMHAYGEIIGFVAGWKTLPADKRKVTDAQVDALLTKLLSPPDLPSTGYKLVTDTAGQLAALQGAITDIAGIYGFSAAEVESFKKNN